MNTLSKKERLSGKKDIARLLDRGRYGNADGLRYCILPDNGLGFCRLMVSVPKKNFRRAVRRNLLKRRLREAFRTQKPEGASADILLIYTTREILPFERIRAGVAEALSHIPAAV